ncbi:putative coiled-coil domain-containing protein 144C [Phodopus roborovskii]|uniref:putative coiled-coil domain-containing protein 144C n=1 Tax=Phodopus roborovskii TaxID=109678 RepID=UPI0021E4DD8D|nr:putative coiled-coil domain-containing protein 144C [Phodopus roborovskii]
MKKIFKGHSPWGFLGFRQENQELPWYLTGYTPVKKIHKAASVGDITQVQRMLEFGDVNVNITDRKKRTALHYACAHGQSEMVNLLLWYDCNIEARDRDESTALIKATQRQHKECVKILLENGADPNAIDANHNAALHYAVYNNSISIAATLLAFNADTEIKTKNGYTPLILAVIENKQEMVELLLQAAANINALDNFKRSALMHAMRAQSKNMISLLLQQGADTSLGNVYRATAQRHTDFETFQVFSQGPSSNNLEPTTGEGRHNFDIKDDCIPCTYPTQDNKERMAQLPAKEEESIDTVDKLGSLAHEFRNPKPTTEEDEHSFNSKTSVAQSPMLTESSLWIGYPADWPEPVKFSRQPAVYNPIEWREDMESRSVPLQENQHPAAVLSGKEANVQTPERPARVSKEPGATDSDPTEKENAKDELVSLLAPLEENKPQMKEFSVAEAAKFQTDVKLDGQSVLEYEENGLKTCQESNLEAAESSKSCSILRFFTKPDRSDAEPTARKDEYNFDTKAKDKLEKHSLPQRASQHPGKQTSAPPLQLQEQGQEPEMSTSSDGENMAKHSRSAKGQVLRGALIGDKLKGKDALQLVVNKLSQKVGDVCEPVKSYVHQEEERSRDDCTGKPPLRLASPKLAGDVLDCEDRDGAAALVSEAPQTFPEQKEGGLGNVFPCPWSSQVVENSGQSISKFPLRKNKLDYEGNKFEIEESLHICKEKSSKNTESKKIRCRCPEVCLGEKQEGCEFKSKLKKSTEPKHMDWPLDIRYMPKFSESRGLSDAKERNHVSELKSWGDSTLCDTYKKIKGTQKPLHSCCEAPVHTVGTISATPPGGRTASNFADEDFQDRLSDTEFRILEEEILAWEKVHLENESVCENLPNKYEGFSSDATDLKGKYRENEHTGELDSEVTTQSEQKSLDGSENNQLQSGQSQGVSVSVSTFTCFDTPVSNNISPCLKLTSKVEEMSKQWPSPEVEVSESLCLTVTDCNDNGWIVKRKGGRTKKLFPSEDKDELAKSAPDTCMKEIRKTEREAWTPRQAVITPVFEKSLPEAAGLLLVKDGHHLSKMGQAERRLTKRQVTEKHKAAKKSNPGSHSSMKVMETDAEKEGGIVAADFQMPSCRRPVSVLLKGSRQICGVLPRCSHPSCVLSCGLRKPQSYQIHLPRQNSGSLLKLWDIVHSYERQMELKNSHYELLTRKLENMENMASGIQREQTEINKIKPWLQNKRVDLEELCTLRFPLKQGEKQENAESTFQQKMQLSRKEELCDENAEWTQHPENRTANMDVKVLENGLRQLYKLKEDLETTYYKYLHMVVKLQFMEQELIVIKTEHKKRGHLLKDHTHSEEVLPCRNQMRECATQARDQNNTEDLRDTNEFVTLDQMELRIKNLESQLAMREAQQSLHEGGVLKPEHCYAEESSMMPPLRAELSEQAKQSPRK